MHCFDLEDMIHVSVRFRNFEVNATHEELDGVGLSLLNIIRTILDSRTFYVGIV